MIVKKDFGGLEIDFEPSIVDGSIMVNATQMAKAFNKDVYQFTRTDNMQKFIKAFCQTAKLRFGDEFSPNGKLIKICKGDPSISGTWMHRTVAIKFAAWLDPYFELWIYKTIDEILFGYSREYDQSIERAVKLTHELKILTKKTDKDIKDFDRFLMLSDQLTAEKTHRANLTRSRFSEIYRDIKPVLQKN
jgi:hypothetical protein